MTKHDKIKEIKNKLERKFVDWYHHRTIALYNCNSIPFKQLTFNILDDSFDLNIDFSGLGREEVFSIHISHEALFQEFLSWLEEQPEEVIDKVLKEIEEKLEEED